LSGSLHARGFVWFAACASVCERRTDGLIAMLEAEVSGVRHVGCAQRRKPDVSLRLYVVFNVVYCSAANQCLLKVASFAAQVLLPRC
jgi:hypothetical protein